MSDGCLQRLRQTLTDLELLVVTTLDGCHSRTACGIADTRLRVLRNEEQQGLARSLNRGLDDTRAIRRPPDAADVAPPARIERQLVRLRSTDRRCRGLG
jgi:hypothetical protein